VLIYIYINEEILSFQCFLLYSMNQFYHGEGEGEALFLHSINSRPRRRWEVGSITQLATVAAGTVVGAAAAADWLQHRGRVPQHLMRWPWGSTEVVAGFLLDLDAARFLLMCTGKHARGSQLVHIRGLETGGFRIWGSCMSVD
jgi:hypothetical protein